MMSLRHVSKEAKNLLKNTIQSTEFYNKRKEEDMMWQLHQRTKRMETDSDDDSGPDSRKKRHKPNSEKNYWMAKLLKKEKTMERWDHSGYKELYPEEFSSDSDSERKVSKKKKKQKKKSKKSKSSLKKKKTKKHKKKKNKTNK